MVAGLAWMVEVLCTVSLGYGIAHRHDRAHDMAAMCHDGASAPNCAMAWIPTNMSECMASAPATCAVAAGTEAFPANASGVGEQSIDGTAYGAALSIVCDIVIAIGLGPCRSSLWRNRT